MKADEGLCVFGAGVLDDYLDDMLQEIEGVRKASGSDPVHDMRVASRRLRAALPLFSDCFPKKKFPDWVKHVKQITGALGRARDLDVQLELVHTFESEHNTERYRPGLRRLQLRLQQKRTKTQRKVDQALDDFDKSDTSGEIKKRLEPYLLKHDQVYLYTPALYLLGHDSILDKLTDFLSYEPFIYHPENITELHAMRIAAKRLRYTMEIFAPLYPGELKDPIQATRKAQDLLGEIHDADVWIGFLPQFIEDERSRTLDYFGNLRSFHRLTPGITCFLEDRQAQREKKYQEFITFWEKQKAPEATRDETVDGGIESTPPRKETTRKATWQNLLQTIQIPYYQGEQPTPPEETEAETPSESTAV